MSEDIEPILAGWPEGEDGGIRKIVGDDGVEKVQLRVVVEGFRGILQFNCDGRPDGKRPHGSPFALDHYERLRAAHDDVPSSKGPFRLSHEQAEELFEESFLVYQRYVVFLQMNDYARVIRDTGRNMRLFRFVHAHAAESDDRERQEKWWPYIIRLHHTARVMAHLDAGRYDEAAAAIEEARRELGTLAPSDDEVWVNEMERSTKALTELERAVRDRRPPTETDLLEREKRDAIRKQDYERAAELRDRIEELRKNPPRQV